jgi:anti-sigma B factor antagonist
MPTEFSATDEPLDDRTHAVVVRGEVDIFTAPEFKACITASIESGADVVLVDLTETTFIDSSCLGVLISAHRRLGMRDGRLVVVTQVESVLTTLRITGLDGVFDVVPTREAALALTD